jgi:hypothetical protein
MRIGWKAGAKTVSANSPRGNRFSAVAAGNVLRIIRFMIEDLRNLVTAKNFTPFTIAMSGGEIFEVPSRDHILMAKSMAVVKDDRGSVHLLPFLHVARVTSRDSDVESFVEPTSAPPE